MIDIHIRIPDVLAEIIKEESEKNFRSINGEIVYDLTQYFLGLMDKTGDGNVENCLYENIAVEHKL
jgi:hypothetical protein